MQKRLQLLWLVATIPIAHTTQLELIEDHLVVLKEDEWVVAECFQDKYQGI